MDVKRLAKVDDGLNTVEVRCSTIGLGSLIRTLRKLAGVEVQELHQNAFTNEASAILIYKGFRINIFTPFSDYWIQQSSDCPEEVFFEVVEHLERSKVRWWNRIS
jgi:hypothetical protein